MIQFLDFKLQTVNILVFGWLSALTILYWYSTRHYRNLTKGVKGMDLKTLLEKHLERIDLSRRELASLKKGVKEMRKEDLKHLQKVGIVRFNPFKDEGGDQSFAVALLDGQDNGIVISSLYGREETRIYSKPVKNKKASGYELSKEEKEAIEKACT